MRVVSAGLCLRPRQLCELPRIFQLFWVCTAAQRVPSGRRRPGGACRGNTFLRTGPHATHGGGALSAIVGVRGRLSWQHRTLCTPVLLPSVRLQVATEPCTLPGTTVMAPLL